SSREKKYERRPHGDHNPRHGGLFFMADDNWHHLEGTYRPNGTFRVYFYNDYTQAIPPAGFSGRVAVLDAKDNEVTSFPLKRSLVRNALDAPITGAELPLSLKLHVKFKADDKDRVFDFPFKEPSKEPAAPPKTPMPAASPP